MKVTRDHQGLTDMSEDVDTTLSERQKKAAAKIVASCAVGETRAEQLADLEDLLHMLGIHPNDIPEPGVVVRPVLALP